MCSTLVPRHYLRQYLGTRDNFCALVTRVARVTAAAVTATATAVTATAFATALTALAFTTATAATLTAATRNSEFSFGWSRGNSQSLRIGQSLRGLEPR
jgi:hypothetical protein